MSIVWIPFSCNYEVDITSTILFLCVVNLLFEYTDAARIFHDCSGRELLGKILPSTRNLWHASSEAEWEKEFNMQCVRAVSHGRGEEFTYSDLLQYGLRGDGSLDPWLSEIDEFGNLVIAAASLEAEVI